jgi:endonuclease YncB( thermonuclease family)
MARKSAQKRRRKPRIKKERCRVASVYDGDTITVERVHSSWFGLKKQVSHAKVRLAYSDTPLRHQEFGAASARDVLEQLIEGKDVLLEYEILPHGAPRTGDFNRILAVVHLQHLILPNQNVNELLLREGLARIYRKADDITPHYRRRFLRAEKYAKRHQLGIWQQSASQQPRRQYGAWFVMGIGILIGMLIGLVLFSP